MLTLSCHTKIKSFNIFYLLISRRKRVKRSLSESGRKLASFHFKWDSDQINTFHVCLSMVCITLPDTDTDIETKIYTDIYIEIYIEPN